MHTNDLRSALAEKLKTFDRKGADEICNKLVTEIFHSPARFDAGMGGKIMQDLRSKRMFDLMQLVGDALILVGVTSFKIRKLYAQALIDQNYLVAARVVVNALIADAGGNQERDAREELMEARGLLGRVYKQHYINTSLAASAKLDRFLKDAIDAYFNVYSQDANYTWQGINVVALLLRAQRDNIPVPGYPNPQDMAAGILKLIKENYDNDEAKAWDFATACEACVALGDVQNALEWLSGYARMPNVDAFELTSTLRQLEEVWQLDVSSEMGQLLLPIIRAELLNRQGGTVTLTAEDVKVQRQVASRYQAIATKDNAEDPKLEKAFTNNSFRTYEWFKTGTNRCQAVARIGRLTSTGTGTGFLLKGESLHDSLAGELVLLTNAHVVSEDPEEKHALRPAQAVVIFETLDIKEKFKVSKIIWTSPRSKLDATLLRFDPESLIRLKLLTEQVELYPICDSLPDIDPKDESERIFIIGHPHGGTLQISFYDNLLLDHEDPRIHYRTPTQVGNSGSPVFNEQWELIGLHHSGSANMSKLNKREGTYEANEGIWIKSIKKALDLQLGILT